MSEFTTRRAVAADAPELLRLMRALAEFEGYADRFAVTEAELLARGLGTVDTAPEFVAFVTGTRGHRLAGMAVVVERAFTFDLRPSLLLKELYVDEDARGSGVGSALMRAVLAYTRERKAGELAWDVLPGNDDAKAFYRRWGGAPVTAWERWSWRPA